MIRLIFFLIGSLTLHQANSLELPKPADSEYFYTEVAGFALDEDSFQYAITYRIKSPFSEDQPATVEFQNTKSLKKTITTDIVIPAGDTELIVKSPKLPGMKNKKNYKVVLRFQLDDSITFEHTDFVQFSIPRSLIKQLKKQGVAF